MTVKELIAILQQYEQDQEVAVTDCRDEYYTLEEKDVGNGVFGVVIDISDKNM